MNRRSYIIERERGRAGDRGIVETGPDGRRVVALVPELCSVDVLEAIRAAYANGRADEAAEQAEPLTRVMFRKFRDGSGDIIALFPDLPGDTHNPGMCESYMHNGQHGAADLTGAVYQLTSPARPEEFAALKAELEAPLYGYRLKIVLRTPANSAELRAKALRRPS